MLGRSAPPHAHGPDLLQDDAPPSTRDSPGPEPAGDVQQAHELQQAVVVTPATARRLQRPQRVDERRRKLLVHEQRRHGIAGDQATAGLVVQRPAIQRVQMPIAQPRLARLAGKKRSSRSLSPAADGFSPHQVWSTLQFTAVRKAS